MNVTHHLTLPAREVFRKKIGKNNVVHIAEPGGVTGLEYKGNEGKAHVFTDNLGRRIFLYPSRVKTDEPESDYKLRIRGSLSSLEELGPDIQLQWLAHASDTWDSTPEMIVASWRNEFRFVQEVGSDLPGLREPQIGAIHAISAHWTLKQSPATVVLPTGTGKTETMLSVMIQCQCPRILIVVPSDALRAQLSDKFRTLGCLREIGAVPSNVVLPCVGMMKSSIRDREEAEAFAKATNVIIATATILNHCSNEAQRRLAHFCSHLFVDEAHHLAAQTWNRIKDMFVKKLIVQFTATPFRRDGKRIAGMIIYNYPLGRAQQMEYFRHVELCPVDELDDDKADRAIAQKALARLRSDMEKGHDHLILARVNSIRETVRVAQIYEELAPEFCPVPIHSQTASNEKAVRLKKLCERESRVLICVDMFGEGFDLPQLKIAAMHDIHKSLPITLQFIGRFTRAAENVGDASVVVNVADPQVDAELQSLYAENADWNYLLRRSSEERIEREVSLQELIESFEGNLPSEVPLWNLRPTMSTLIYSPTKASWTPHQLVDVLPKSEVCWHASSSEKQTVVAVFAKQEDVKWGRYRDIRDWSWYLVVGYWCNDLQLLFLHASDYNVLNCNKVARAIIGDTAQLVNGPRIFRVFHGIERPMVKNLGASKAGTVRYTMYFGPDVSAGLSQVEKAEAELNNVFGWGYETGERVTRGCSIRKGKVWAVTGGPIIDWQNWCSGIGTKLNNDKINENEITAGFLKPQELDARPSQVPVAIEWGESIAREDESRVTFRIAASDYYLSEVDLVITDYSEQGPIMFAITVGDKKSTYRLTIGKQNSSMLPHQYERISGADILVRIGSREFFSVTEWVHRDPFVVMYADGSFSYNQFFVNAACPGKFDARLLKPIDWKGIDIRKESEGRERDVTSIQYRMIQNIYDDYEVIFNDDDSGEAADIVAIRQDADDQVLLLLVHCKFSSADQPGARINDLYQLCGQAQKSIRWKHGGMKNLLAHMRSRQQKWSDAGHTRFVKGNLGDVRRFEKLARRYRLSFDVMIAQPGLSKQQVSDSILYLLGTTDLFLKRTADTRLTVFCSD